MLYLNLERLHTNIHFKFFKKKIFLASHNFFFFVGSSSAGVTHSILELLHVDHQNFQHYAFLLQYMQYTVWWTQYILNIVIKQWCAPYTEREKANKKYHMATNLLGLSPPSVFEFRGTTVLCNMQGSGTPAAGSTHFYRSSMPVPCMQKLLCLQKGSMEFIILTDAEAYFPFRNKAVCLFRTKCLISKLHLNINKICRQLELYRKCSLTIFII